MDSYETNEDDVYFECTLEDGRRVKCYRAEHQAYSDALFSAGHVEGIPPDTIYFRLEKDGFDSLILYLRPDEAQAIIYCISGALWSLSILEASDEEKGFRLNHDIEAVCE